MLSLLDVDFLAAASSSTKKKKSKKELVVSRDGMATPWLAAGLAVPALFLLGGGKDKDGKGKKGGGGSKSSMVDLDEFDR